MVRQESDLEKLLARIKGEKVKRKAEASLLRSQTTQVSKLKEKLSAVEMANRKLKVILVTKEY